MVYPPRRASLTDKFITAVPAIFLAHVFIMSSYISVNMIFIVHNEVIIKMGLETGRKEAEAFPESGDGPDVPLDMRGTLYIYLKLPS